MLPKSVRTHSLFEIFIVNQPVSACIHIYFTEAMDTGDTPYMSMHGQLFATYDLLLKFSELTNATIFPSHYCVSSHSVTTKHSHRILLPALWYDQTLNLNKPQNKLHRHPSPCAPLH